MSSEGVSGLLNADKVSHAFYLDWLVPLLKLNVPLGLALLCTVLAVVIVLALFGRREHRIYLGALSKQQEERIKEIAKEIAEQAVKYALRDLLDSDPPQ